MVDRYTRIVLTIIASALSAIVLQNFVQVAPAQNSYTCGSGSNPCWVQSAPSHPVYVASKPSEPLVVMSNPKIGFYVSTAPLEPLAVKIVR